MKNQSTFWRGRRRVWNVFLRSILLACTLLSVSFVSAQDQKKITVEFKDEVLSNVLKQLEKLSDYKILFTYNEVQNHKVTASLKNLTILEALKEVLAGKPFVNSGITDGKYITVKFQAVQADISKMKKVKGTVLDAKFELLPGATVIIKGTTVGVAANGDGQFELLIPSTVKSPITLIFSCVGKKSQEITLKNDKPLEVVLEEDINEMEEVVVNGIFSQSKNSYTGSVSSIKSEDILAVSQTDLFKALTVLVPSIRIVENNEQGSNPNHVPELLIRGTTSIATQGEEGLNTPLIIVDGVEMTLEQLYDIDIFDIERVDVLKDASATAIYGDRAANGVIVVERKKVKDSKLRLRYNFVPDIGFPDVSSFDLCDPMEKLILEDRFGLYKDAQGRKEMEYYEKLERISRGVNTDWKSIPLRNSFSHNHSLSASGRGGGMDYSISARYGDTYGVMKKDYRRNYGIGFYFSYYLSNKLLINFRGDYSRTNAKNSPYGNFSEWVILNPYDSPYDEFGELLPKLSFDRNNPMYNATTGSFTKSKSENLSANLSLRWDFSKGFYATLRGNVQLYDYQFDQYYSSLHTSNLNDASLEERGTYFLSKAEQTSWSAQATVTYSHSFDEKGTVFSFNAGGQLDQSDAENYSFNAKGFLKPTFSYLSFASQYGGDSPTGGNTYGSSVSAYANANFILWNRYFVDGSYRSSANSSLGENNRWAPYWSFGIGWNLHNENFIHNLGDISILRIRGSIGYVGSGNFNGSNTQSVYTYGGKYISGLGAVPNKLSNPDLKAQRTLSYNAGFNMEALDSRLDITFDWYKQISKDLLLPIGLPYSTGSTQIMANLGKSENWGYELSISGVLIKTKDWFWRLSFNAHHTENKLVKISNSLKQQNSSNMAERGITPKVQFEEGEDINSIYAVPSLGINPANGKEYFYSKNGEIVDEYNAADKVAIGTATPKLEGSMYTALRWKNLSLNVAWTYTVGGYLYNSTRASKVENINPELNVDRRAFTDRWVKPGDVVAYPRTQLDLPYVHSTRFVEKRNEFYLSSINVSYNLPGRIVRKLGMKRLALGIGFSDILRISTVKFERGTSYPYMRGYNFTISPTF